MRQPKYQRRHYQDVAQILRTEYQRVYDFEYQDAERTVDMIRKSFERLFQADSPDTFDLERFRRIARSWPGD